MFYYLNSWHIHLSSDCINQMDLYRKSSWIDILYLIQYEPTYLQRGHRGRDHMVVDLQLPMQLVPITTDVVNSNLDHGEVYSIKHYVIKFVSDLRQVGGFLRFPPPIKLTATI